MYFPDSYTPTTEVLRLVEQYESNPELSLISQFSAEDIAQIATFYVYIAKLNKALVICETALDFYAYNLPLIEVYLGALTVASKLEELIEFVDRLEILIKVSDVVIFLKANALHALGDSKEALKLLENYLSIAESKSNIYFQIGEIYKADANHLQAQDHYKLALKADIDNYDPLHEILDFHTELNLLDIIVAYLEELTVNNPLSKNAWFGYGYCLHKLNLFDKAVECFSNSLAIDPTDEKSWLHKAHSLMNLQRFEEAYNCYLEAYNLEGESASLFVHLGAAQEHQKNFTKAIDYYKQALKLDQDYEDAYYGIGMCFLTQERYMESMHYLKKAISLNNEHELFWLALAQAEWKTGNIVSALEAFEQSCEIDPENADVWLDWSFIYYDQGDYDRAIHLILEGIDELPIEAELWYRAVVYALGSGRYKDALNYLENALLLDFEKHTVLFDFFTEIETQKTLFKLIEQFRQRNQ
jgi:tetratricopeptide (TPR) repeat protein